VNSQPVTTPSDTSDPEAVSPTKRAAAVGTVTAAVASIPLVGPSLIAGCLSCLGVGAATGLGATSTLPPVWWLTGLAVTATGIVVADRHAARRCQRRPAPGRTLAVLIIVATAAWVATRFVAVPALDWISGGPTPPSDGPTLP
jgi:hypothetical protein